MDFVTDQTENVFPMVRRQGLAEMILVDSGRARLRTQASGR